MQFKHSRDPGDRPESLLARRAFLAAGHYAPLRQAVADWVSARAPRRLLDVGCGEGDYTAALQAEGRAVAGLDIAKPALRMAARRHPGPQWLVASNAQLPLPDASLEAVVTLFTPLVPAELARVLAPGGALLVVTPGPDHLLSLREQLFERIEPHRPEKFLSALEGAFRAEAPIELTVDLALSATALDQLLTMTPYAWKARPERLQALRARPGLSTRAVFSLLGLRRL